MAQRFGKRRQARHPRIGMARVPAQGNTRAVIVAVQLHQGQIEMTPSLAGAEAQARSGADRLGIEPDQPLEQDIGACRKPLQMVIPHGLAEPGATQTQPALPPVGAHPQIAPDPRLRQTVQGNAAQRQGDTDPGPGVAAGLRQQVPCALANGMQLCHHPSCSRPLYCETRWRASYTSDAQDGT